MAETNPDILAARARLQAKLSSGGQLGGKGTQRRKVKSSTNRPAGASVADDKKLLPQFKKLGLNAIQGIEEVNMFTSNNEVIHFSSPKVLASLQANTYAIQGSHETKTLKEMLPRVLSQIGNENLLSLRKMVEAAASGMEGGEGGVPGDDIPDMAATNFEAVSQG